MEQTRNITIAYGDGHAPDVMEAVLTILREAGIPLRVETIEIGSRIYAMESKTGILPLAWPVLARNGILLMAPIICPEGEEIIDTGSIIREKMGLAESAPLLFIDPFTDKTTAKSYTGAEFALFEPIYDDTSLLEKGKSDPSPMLHAALMMLVHIGQYQSATLIHNAWLVAKENGAGKRKGKRLQKLTEAIIESFGKRPNTLNPVEYLPEPESATTH